MKEPIKYISEVEIRNLWKSTTLNWILKPDVNILSGKNGSGKSTILDCIYGVVNEGGLNHLLSGNVEYIKITFNNSKSIVYEHIYGTKKSIEEKAKFNKKYDNVLSDIKEQEGNSYKLIKSLSFSIIDLDSLEMPLSKLHDLININAISTFDNLLLESEAVQKLSDESIKTELDWQIYNLQKRYLDYQLSLGKKAIEALKKRNFKDKDVTRTSQYKDLFLRLMDKLFKESGKKINKDKNELSFLMGNKEISPYQLSSGEKQILVILLTVLLQDNEPSILIMDEPEISLHFDWQRKLIEYIKSLNHSVQIILATHSPAVVMEGWTDKVIEVSDLIETK